MNTTAVLLDLETARRVHNTCERFEVAWSGPIKPRIVEFIATVTGPERSHLLAELLALEVELRRSTGETPDLAEYLGQFTETEDCEIVRTTFATTTGGGTVRVEGYEILKELGRGGMGVVYLARDIKLKRLVALKMILAGGHSGSQHLARFRNEAEVVARLQHPNIVQIFDVGECDSRPFLALEYIEGPTLGSLTDREPQTPAFAAEVVQALAQAVHYAHTKGIIHRDLKPGNVIMARSVAVPESGRSTASFHAPGSASGQHTTAGGMVPKITDFGLAKDLVSGSEQTSTGAILGTPNYMSPEQADGRIRDIGPGTDIYSLGAILYGLVTGRPPFQGASPIETIKLVIDSEPPAPSQLRPGIPRDLQTICLKCLQKDAARRYDSAAALAEDLGRFLADEPILARPVSPMEKGWRWCRRNPVVAGLTAAVFAVLIAGVVVSMNYALKAKRDAETAKTETARAEAMAQRARERAYFSDMRQLPTAWDENTLGRVYDLLAAQQPEQTDGVDLRGFEWHYWNRKASPPRLVGRNDAAIVGVSISPDGAHVASIGRNRVIRIWHLEEGCELLTIPAPVGQLTRVQFHPDGQRLLTSGEDGAVRIWSISERKTLHRLTGHQGVVHSAAWSRDGTKIVSAGADGTVRIWDTATQTETRVIPAHGRPVLSASFNPAGDRIVSGGQDDLAKVWDAATGRELFSLKGHTREIRSAVFSPDGTVIATGSQDLTAKIWNAATGKHLHTLKGHTWDIWTVAFSPDGRRLATDNFDRTVKVWNIATGEELATIKGHTVSVVSVEFHPDGRRIVTASYDGTLRIATIPETDPYCIESHRSELCAVACSPDGRWLATSGGNADKDGRRLPFGELFLHDRAGREPVRTLEGHKNSVICVGFSPDHRFLASVCGTRNAETQKVNGELRIWNAADFKPVATVSTLETTPCHLAISRDSQWIAVGGRAGDLEVRRLPDGRDAFTLPGLTKEVTAIAFSHDGRHLVAGGFDECIKVWNLETRSLVRTIPIGQKVSCVNFSPDGEQLAVSDYSIDVHLFDTGTWQEVKQLRGHTGGVTSVVYSPDGKRLATGGEDFTVKVWDRATAQELLTLRGHSKVLRSVAFSPDGHVLYSGSWDCTVRIWDATPLNSEKNDKP